MCRGRKPRFSPELDTTLTFDALECSDRQIGIWVGNRHNAGLFGMSELLMASCLPNFEPTCCFDRFYNFTRFQIISSFQYTYYTHYDEFCQGFVCIKCV